MKCCDVRTNSLKQYHGECMKNSVERMHVDVGAERLKGLKHFLLQRAISVIANHLSWFFKQSIPHRTKEDCSDLPAHYVRYFGGEDLQKADF